MANQTCSDELKNTILDSLQQAEALQQTSAWSALENLSAQIRVQIDEHINDLGGCKSVGTYEGEKQNPSHEECRAFIALRAKTTRFLAESKWRRGDYADGTGYIESALADARESGDTIEEVRCLVGCGIIHFEVSNYTVAHKYLEQALELARRLGDKSGEARALSNLGLVCSALHKTDDTLKNYHLALRLNREIGRVEGEGRVLMNLGVVEYNRQNYSAAFDFFQEALVIEKKLKRQEAIAQIYHNLGNICLESGDYAHALDYYFSAIEIEQHLQALPMLAFSLHTIGSTYERVRDLDNALEYSTKALHVAQECRHRLMEGRSHALLAIVYMALAEYDKALQHQQTALDISESIGDHHTFASVLSNMGTVYWAQHNTAEGVRLWKESQKRFETLNDSRELARNAANMAEAFSDKESDLYDPIRSMEYAHQAIRLYDEAETPLLKRGPLQTLAVLHEQLGEWKKAVDCYKTLESIRRQSQLDERRSETLRKHFEHRFAQLERDQRDAAQQATLRQHELELLLNSQKRELDLRVQMLVDKNNFLNGLSRSLQQISSSVRTHAAEQLDICIENIRKNLASVESLDHLDQQIRHAHTQFIEKLQAHCPELSPTELKIAVLLNMKLSSTAIGSLLYLSHRTVEVHRAKIRRKLKISSKQSIYGELENIAGQTA